MEKMTIGKMKRRIKNKGVSHFFDEDATEFWNSRIESMLTKNGLFLESIDDFYRTKRLYTVNCFSLDGHVHVLTFYNDDVSYETFDKKEDAQRFMNLLSIQLSNLGQIKSVKHLAKGYEFTDYKERVKRIGV